MRFRTLLTACLTLCGLSLPALSLPARATWLRAESPQFVVYSDGSERNLRAFVQNLQDFDAVLRVESNLKPDATAKLPMYLVSSQSRLKEVDPYADQRLIGFYDATVIGEMAVAVRAGLDQDWMPAQTVVLHEYTHHFMARYFPGVFPEWYSEGIAEYFSTAQFKSDTVEVGYFTPERLYFLQTGTWLPLARLFHPSAEDRKSPMFYPEAWLLTQYFEEDNDRRKQLEHYLMALRAGADGDTAFKDNTGKTVAEFDAVLKAYLSHRKIITHIIKRPTAISDSDIAVTPMAPSADKLLLPQARLISNHVQRGDGPAAVKQITQLAAAFPDDPLALRTLALVDILYGDLDKADAPLDKLLAANPQDVDANYLKALRYVRAGRQMPDRRAELWAKAKPFTTAVHNVDPNHYQSLFLYGQIALADAGVPSENILNVLALAHELAPRVSPIILTTANALARAKHFGEAKVLLESLAFDPHSGGNVQAAQEMLAKVNAAMAKGDKAKDIPTEAP